MNGDIDNKIIELIKKNEKISNSEISGILGIPEDEVAQRIEGFSDKRSKILLVDDEIDTLLPLKRSLEVEDYIVIGAGNGPEALIKAKTEIPDIILLDLMMPEMDGYEVCEKLKKDPITKNIPVIILTAKDAVRDKVKGLDIGADDYVTKPFNLNELKARVKSVLRRTKN
ncbi:MAG: transcriptional regulator [Candidatus Methanoperedens nitroreducens]|uniref:Transcriptional regulator n=1 Tax=Candidatus Methanoperedens nitratireducens TaxID=1392998 RepID=A0A0N8KQL3_9EURY|nr:response regulator [Candidatus Methanoperedens sp. BLZ2]KAB2946454.1 MAG: response regulator [Candidatus Methanoperedens sp.]KPQ42458.1 MAG: transcriptional regulator [Candidatus Methanoperedens sp. BLZ1]MBZ0175691.1 response regulator [Candidatus Methanoperedens nitroreducens]CAG0972352.1 Alkaline phosphatase synthesis transcriptional regulatory protein PhoP [Methanosarcinales archaeon]MCX9088340.1 response regulator [Candidatus Methanoperedens sp.]